MHQDSLKPHTLAEHHIDAMARDAGYRREVIVGAFLALTIIWLFRLAGGSDDVYDVCLHATLQSRRHSVKPVETRVADQVPRFYSEPRLSSMT
jgi:hypothetical protein